MKTSMSFDVDDYLLETYLFYSGVLVLKVLTMAVWTASIRLVNNVVANPEDAKLNKKYKVKYDDVDIERLRRAHLNDLENIPFFLIACFGYMLTKPNVFIATNLIRLFVMSRIMHTIVYCVIIVRQPARIVAWLLAYLVVIYMALRVVIYFA